MRPETASASALLDSVAAGIVVLRHDGAIESFNPAAARLLGPRCRPGELLSSLLELPDQTGKRPDAFERFSARGVRVTDTDGAARLDVIIAVTGDANSEEFARVVTLLDASGRVEAEEQLTRLRDRLAESERDRARLMSVQEELNELEPDGPSRMVGSSQGLRRVRAQIARVASSDTTVLIQGETGTGKELVARLIHSESGRASHPFVAINCAALPESLIESELFGHERGAFTGADRRRLGKFELAEGGTIFLDEIAELPLGAQAKLLRVLQEGTFERVGGAETIRSNARVVAATHRELARRVERGLFREDLYYRLNVFRVDVPPLRERREDLRELIDYLHARVARRLARPVLKLSERSLRRVMAYRWPGNIRELANAVERATLLADGPELEIELPESPAAGNRDEAPTKTSPAEQTRDILLDLTLEQLQRLHIMHALESTGYRVFGPGGAADRLEINPNTLLSRMDKYGIPRPRLMRRSDPGSR